MPSLQDKLDASASFMASLLKGRDPSRIAVAWTGGKDSTVVLDLWRTMVSGPVTAINLDTGFKFPEILAFRDRMSSLWAVDLRVVRPDPAHVPQTVAEDKLTCCRSLKVLPLRQAVSRLNVEVLLTGVRADETPARAATLLLEERDGYLQANPILDWTEMDVWAHLTGKAIPYCELYDQGYRSIGCMPCTEKAMPGLGERGGRDGEKEARMAELRALGYF